MSHSYVFIDKHYKVHITSLDFLVGKTKVRGLHLHEEDPSGRLVNSVCPKLYKCLLLRSRAVQHAGYSLKYINTIIQNMYTLTPFPDLLILICLIQLRQLSGLVLHSSADEKDWYPGSL